jgi:hypothetical protein
MGAVFIVGDVHGHLEKLAEVLRDAELIDADRAWTGRDSVLWLMGDLVNHGPDGIGAIDLVIALQRQASQEGGRVEALIGNHDLVLLAAHRFGERPTPGKDQTFREHWQENGGVARDLDEITSDQVRWLSARPAMARVGDHLLVHGDTLLYTRYGGSLEEVNQAFATLLASDDALRWYRLLNEFSEHQTFADAASGAARADDFMAHFGGRQIVHGHTPVTTMTGQPAEAVREPLLYAGDRCLDVDPGMYLGGAGFIYRLPASE